jgi:hypothetical protein
MFLQCGPSHWRAGTLAAALQMRSCADPALPAWWRKE